MPTRRGASYQVRELFRKAAYASPIHKWMGLGRRRYDKSFWDKQLAGEWSFHLGGTVSGQARDSITLALIRILSPEAKNLLDVACASGSLFRASKGEYAYTGVDISDTAVSQGRELSPTAKFVVSPMEAFTPEERYDVIVISEVLYFLTVDEALQLSERYAAYLAPKGLLIVTMARDAKAAAIFTGLARKMNWVNGFVYQEKKEGPNFNVKSQQTRVYLTGAYAAR
jgi:2-polyprenyl-3-methyl-5-hydroxy-6-metoxy-1,4-benzoquinol methylase